jgi:DNA polymerase III delta prime subunit
MYIFGYSGAGKTTLVRNVLRELNYDTVVYDTGEVRNKSMIETMTCNNMSDKNILSMMQERRDCSYYEDENGNPVYHRKRIVLLMDEIDGLNSGDKGGINSLIKLIRHKKTKKQKNEQMTMNPVICIGNYYSDKKIKELMKVCVQLEIKRPSFEQMKKLMSELLPGPSDTTDAEIREKIAWNANGDLRQLHSLLGIYKNNPNIFGNSESCRYLTVPRNHVSNAKSITEKLFQHKYSIDDHNLVMNDTDRTIVALLFHENLLDFIPPTATATAITTATDKHKQTDWASINLYETILGKICFADYMDRVTFQNQIWQFNEMSSLIKTMHTHKILHDNCVPIQREEISPTTEHRQTEFRLPIIRFTKVLTKYSTEYNNALFVQNLCQILQVDRKDCFTFFDGLRYRGGGRGDSGPPRELALARAPPQLGPTSLTINKKRIDNSFIANIENMFNMMGIEIAKLFIKRIYRYLDAESILAATVPSAFDTSCWPLPHEEDTGVLDDSLLLDMNLDWTD